MTAVPHQHHHDDVDVLEPEVELDPEVRYLPPTRQRQRRQRRPSMTWGIITGLVHIVQSTVILAVIGVCLTIVFLWAALAYGGNALPAFGDWFHNQVTPDTTTTSAP